MKRKSVIKVKKPDKKKGSFIVFDLYIQKTESFFVKKLERKYLY